MTSPYEALLGKIRQYEEEREKVARDIKKAEAEPQLDKETLLGLYRRCSAMDECLASLYGDRKALRSAQSVPGLIEPAKVAPASTATEPEPDGKSPLEAAPCLGDAISFISCGGSKIGMGVRVLGRYLLTALHTVTDSSKQPCTGLQAFGSDLELLDADASSNMAIFNILNPPQPGYSIPLMDCRTTIKADQQVWLLARQDTAAGVPCTCQPGMVLNYPDTAHSAVVQYTDGTCQYAGAAVVLGNGQLAGIHTGFYDMSSLASMAARHSSPYSSVGGSSMTSSSLDSRMSVVYSDAACEEQHAAGFTEDKTPCKAVATGLFTTSGTIAVRLVCVGALQNGFLKRASALRKLGMRPKCMKAGGRD